MYTVLVHSPLFPLTVATQDMILNHLIVPPPPEGEAQGQKQQGIKWIQTAEGNGTVGLE